MIVRRISLSPKKLGVFRHHLLSRAVVVLVVYGERRRITLGEDRGMIPKTKIGGTQGRREWRGGTFCGALSGEACVR